MRNEKLNAAILRNLLQVDCGLKERALRCAVEIDLDRPDLSTDDFELALKELEDKALVESFTNLLGAKVWGITAMGKDALKGL